MIGIWSQTYFDRECLPYFFAVVSFFLAIKSYFRIIDINSSDNILHYDILLLGTSHQKIFFHIHPLFASHLGNRYRCLLRKQKSFHFDQKNKTHETKGQLKRHSSLSWDYIIQPTSMLCAPEDISISMKPMDSTKVV